MRPFLEIAYTGVVAVVLHPLRSAVTVFCLIAVLLPYVAGIAISHGVRQEAQTSIDEGPDLFVSALQFGQKVPLPFEAGEQIEAITGVTSVSPRIVGEVFLGKDHVRAVLVGLPAQRFPATISIVDGRLPRAGTTQELVVGTDLARLLNVEVGAMIPPFYRSSQGERVSEVVGLFRSEGSLWQSHMVLTSLQTARQVFDQPAQVTEFLVECRPGYADRVRERILRTVSFSSAEVRNSLRVQAMTRGDMRAFLPRTLLHHEGIFNLHFVLLLVASMLVVMITSGLGLTERRREIGILKATGWQTDEILLRSFSEGLVLSLMGALLALLTAYCWLRFLNGFWIASVFLGGVGATPSFAIPFRLLPAPAVLVVVLSLVIVLTGSLYSSWRAAVVPPSSAMR